MHIVTSKEVAQKLSDYLHHKIELNELVDWAENMIQENDFEKENFNNIRDILAKLGFADVRAFGLNWEDCERFLNQLGYKLKLEVVEN